MPNDRYLCVLMMIEDVGYVQMMTIRLWTSRRPGWTTVLPMRWEALFVDMESQLDAAQAQGRARDVAELTRAERASVHLVDRLRAAAGSEVRIATRSVAVRGTLRDVGTSWVLVDDGRERLVPLLALLTVGGLGDASAPPAGVVVRRLGLGHVLRAIARDRGVVQLSMGSAELVGRIEAVGGDHVDLALVHPDSVRPTGGREVVPFAALDLVSSV